MADKDVLSQEEIDALLQSVDGDESAEDPVAAEATTVNHKADVDAKGQSAVGEHVTGLSEDASKDTVKTVNFGSHERNVRGELPVLEKIYDRTARFFSQDIYQLMARDLDIEQEPLAVIRHRDYLASLPNPTLITIFQLKPLRGKGLICFDSTFVYDLVDYYFGGSSHFAADTDRTDFTATESRVMDITIGKLMANLQQAWLPILPLQVSRMGDETNPQLVHITEPGEMLLVSRFNVKFANESGMFSFVIPYTMVEPIKQQLELGAARPDDEIDPNWINSLVEELMEVELEISAYMAEGSTCLGDVLKWRTDDFIPLEQRKVVTMDIECTPSFEVTIGSAGDKLALQILQKINY
ncbi:MAG: flagellar motor switch protein FliM [Legionellaceae bacterium]|nr:flagellar motor switch protein FliM [Legionellaceae bacterium]